MAAGYGFTPKRWAQDAGATTDSFIIANDETINKGDAVRLDTDGFLVRAGANETLLGIVVGLITRDGISLDNTPPADYGGTYTSGNVGTESYVAADDNETEDRVNALVHVGNGVAYLGRLDADLGTTAASVVGARFDITAAADRIDENTATVGTAQMVCVDNDPTGDDYALFRIFETQVY